MKSKWLNLRATPEFIEQIKDQAKRSGFTQYSKYIEFLVERDEKRLKRKESKK